MAQLPFIKIAVTVDETELASQTEAYYAQLRQTRLPEELTNQLVIDFHAALLERLNHEILSVLDRVEEANQRLEEANDD